jgi:UDP-glucose 4-epimerase
MANWLITGGCGFIGLNLVKELADEGGHEIRVVDNMSFGKADDLKYVCEYKHTHPNNFKEPVVELVEVDIKDKFYMNQVMEDIDYVVHLAAISGVRLSVDDPTTSFTTNVDGTFNLLEAARKNNIKKFIFASSGAGVGDHKPPIHEDLPARPVSPYGATKLAGEGLCTSYYHSFGLETTSLRFSNVYGPFSHRKESLVAKLVKRVLDNKTFNIYGDGNQTRDFVYVDDLVNAIKLCVSTEDIGGEIYQLCTGNESSINFIIGEIIHILKKRAFDDFKLEIVEEKIGDLKTNWADNTKIYNHLGWSPQVKLDEGLENTIGWLIENYKK